MNYTGTVKNVLDFMNYIQSNIWKVINSVEIIENIENIYNLSLYTNYTNPKFLEVEGRDSMFFENTKDYFFMLVPFSIVSFIIFHFIYKALSSRRINIKSLFNSYSLIYGILLVLLV